MIEVQNVTKRYGPVTAVNDVSFRVDSGQILGFLGPNGAGKTTTMRILTGCIPATEGRAIVAGFDVFEDPIEAKRRTGYLPETPPLYPDMTVREYLNFAARINGIGSTSRRERVGSAMSRTSIEDVAALLPRNFGHGAPLEWHILFEALRGVRLELGTPSRDRRLVRNQVVELES